MCRCCSFSRVSVERSLAARLKLTLYLRNAPPWYLRIQAATADVVVGSWPFEQIQEQGLQGFAQSRSVPGKKLAARCRNANNVLLKMRVLQGKGGHRRQLINCCEGLQILN